MASLFGMEKREVIRIKVKKCEGMLQPEYKKMSVDPELTSFDILIRLLAKAFNIKGSFTISYLAKDELGQDVYLSLLSDWDLDAAFLSASDPYLRLKVDLRPFEEGMEDWDVVAPTEVATKQQSTNLGLDRSFLGSLTGVVSAHVGKTVSQVTKAMGLKQEEQQRFHLAKPLMTDPEFRYFMDAVGHMVRPDEFRLMVYQGGVEPSLRSVVWRHLLNVYPEGMSGRERFEYQKKKCNEYYKLRDEWKELFSKGRGTDEMRFIANMVKKDVLRTDRSHKAYAGGDDSANVLSLFNILVTFALTHPDVSYCQGMSDLASPILVVEKDEATSYLCFCGLMKRLRKNFTLEGASMSRMFEHLALVLRHRDPDFYSYLKSQGAHDMFFTYRWLLLELKREFPLDDALLMLEVMWSSLPPDPPEEELELADPEYSVAKLINSPQSPSIANLSQNYLRIKSLCRQVKLRPDFSEEGSSQQAGGDDNGSSEKFSQFIPSHNNAITPAEEVKNINPDDFLPVEDAATKELQERSTSIDESLKSDPSRRRPELSLTEDEVRNENEAQSQKATVDDQKRVAEKLEEIIIADSDQDVINKCNLDGRTPPSSPKRPDTITLKKTFEPKVQTKPPQVSVTSDGSQTTSEQINVTQNPTSDMTQNPGLESKTSSNQSTPRKVRHTMVLTENGVAEETMILNSCEEATEHPSIDFIKVHEKLPKLPPPHEFGDGNPFLMFLCLTLLVQERDRIIQSGMDFNELAMHFDKMVRQHDVYKVLHQAQSLYAVYLRAQTMANSDSSDDVSV